MSHLHMGVLWLVGLVLLIWYIFGDILKAAAQRKTINCIVEHKNEGDNR